MIRKRIHLVCNAHLDPVWLWHWEDGLTEALSTHRIAADFCEGHEDFVFNHNEALLYRWAQEYEPQLFKRIEALVRKGQWEIARRFLPAARRQQQLRRESHPSVPPRPGVFRTDFRAIPPHGVQLRSFRPRRRLSADPGGLWYGTVCLLPTRLRHVRAARGALHPGAIAPGTRLSPVAVTITT